MIVFLCGDVMTGRGIDQILPHPCDPALFEDYVSSAVTYVELAERASGPIPRPVPFDYIWGDALQVLSERSPDLRIANLETSVTADGWPEAKGINYRMHPDNLGCLSAARLDCCMLANNHVADWGMKSLSETVEHLARAGIASAGAGGDVDQAARPAVLHTRSGGRVLVFAFGCPSAGVPSHWAAGNGRPGVNFLADLGQGELERVGRDIRRWREPGDVVIVSVHWGANWGYAVPKAQRRFARGLIDQAGVDLVHGHSSHHAIGAEFHRGRLILHGCGDFINDYEGIRGHEETRPELAAAWLVEIDDDGKRCRGLEIVPFRRRKFRLERASRDDARWLAEMLSRESVGCEMVSAGEVVLTSINAE